MIRSGKTAQEFIQSSFSPNVAILCSSKVNNVMSKNNLTFTELLQPFTSLDFDGHLREPGGTVSIVKNWKLIIKDVFWKPLQPTEARKQLNNAVLHNYNDKTIIFEFDGHKYDIPQATPWFDAWRETYLEVQFPSDHEFTKHFLSCILVATTSDYNIIDTFNNLNQQYAQLQNVTPPKLPKWFNSGVLKSFLLLHDASSAVPQDKVDTLFDSLKQIFGASNCFVLSINSKSSEEPTLTDYWTSCIKRTSDTINEMSSSLTTSPLESRPAFPQTTTANTSDDNQMIVSNIQEGSHPLTTTEVDVYDGANSLQTYSFSGSSESVNVTGRGLDYLTEIHGAALNSNDIDAIKKFLQEYASKALLPYLEKQISQLSELVANRKGVSRSLLSATKRWFGTGKGGNTTGSNTVIYTSDCPELQLRRLGDLWFMCGQWQRAFDVYHTAKREFYADSAWLCYAGALEMAAISAFMAGDTQRKTQGYMEESILTYLNTCRMVQYAVRATLLSALCLTSAGLHGEAAKQLIRMTSEDSDLRSAMLLEQAALCFLCGPGSKAMTRKFAFHMVLAGHRFSKAGQKKHAYRCYKEAYQVYEESGWRLSTDHVQFALGRLAGALKERGAAVRWLTLPLAPRAAHQPAHQQAAFLREYLAAHQQWMENTEEFKDRLPELPLPLLEYDATSVLCVGPAPLSSPGRVPASSLSFNDFTDSRHEEKYWNKMEEMLLQVAQGTVPMIFRPTIDLYTQKTDINPTVPQGEPIQILVTLRNPLKISLILKDVELLWQFVPNQDDTEGLDEVENNELVIAAGGVLESTIIFGQKLKSVMLGGESKEVLTFLLTPMRVGELFIRGLAYRLINVGESGNESGGVAITGKINLSLNDKRLHIMVIPHAPCLQMTFSETNSDAVSGEMRSVDVELRNVGPIDMGGVYFALSHPDCLGLADEQQDDLAVLYDHKYRQEPLYSDERAARLAVWRAAASRHVSLAAGGVPSGACARARLLLRPRTLVPRLFLLAYYPSDSHPRGYRLLRHVFRFNLTEAVDISVTPRRSLRVIEGEIFENMNLAVEVKNVCSEKDQNITIQVLEASLLSRQWKLTDLTAARNRDETLIGHERLHLIMKAKRFGQIPPEGVVEWTCLKVANDPSNAQNVNDPPYSKFLTEYNPPFVETSEIIAQNKDVKSGLIQSMFVLRWKAYDKAKGKVAIGQHCLWLDCFTKAVSREKEYLSVEAPGLQLDDNVSRTDLFEGKKKKKKDNVVILKMEHSNFIDHDFKQNKLCLVPITINIVNCYGIPVKVFIDMSKQQSRESCRELGWAGALSGSEDESQKIGVRVSLASFECRRVSVSAVCAAPGSYLVGDTFAVTATRADTHHTLAHHANNASLLVVKQTV